MGGEKGEQIELLAGELDGPSSDAELAGQQLDVERFDPHQGGKVPWRGAASTIGQRQGNDGLAEVVVAFPPRICVESLGMLAGRHRQW